MLTFIFKLIAYLPLWLNQRLGALLGWILVLFPFAIKRIAAKNIDLCLPYLSPSAQKKLLRNTLIETGKAITESFYIWFRPTAQLFKQVKVVNPTLLDTKKAIIFIAPHLGCWELIGAYLSSLNPTTFLYKPLRSARADALLLVARKIHFSQLASADKSGVAKLQKALLKKQWIGLLSDQNPERSGGVYAQFFARDALTMTLGVKLAKRYPVNVVSIWAERLPKAQGFRIHCEPIKGLSSIKESSPQTTLEEDATLLNKEIERMIQQKPEQYQWGYARFKRDKHDQRTHFYK